MIYFMKLSELMADFEAQADFEGFVTNDDMVLAIDISDSPSTKVTEYVVAQMGISGLDAQLNAESSDKKYIRSGQSSTKVGMQRTFKVSGDKYIGDEFQDFCLSHAVKYGTGQAVIKPYVFFNIFTGKGEKGTVSIIVNSDGGGNAGENATIDIDLKKSGNAPAEFDYSTASQASVMQAKAKSTEK